MKTFCCVALAMALLSGGCLQLIRRPPPAEETGEEMHDWRPQEDIRHEETRHKEVHHEEAAPPKKAALAPPPRAAAKRGDKVRRRARQVNEYALWCIENGMWEEARLHLERATARDSLASSFHNNLGIVYEQDGLLEEALAAYKRAAELAPHRQSYVANLERLESRQRRAAQGADADSLETEKAPRLSPQNDFGE